MSTASQANTQYKYIEKCNKSGELDEFLTSKWMNKKLLDDAIRVIHEASPKFDFYIIKSANAPLRFGRKNSPRSDGKVFSEFRCNKHGLHLYFENTYERTGLPQLYLGDDIEKNEREILEIIERQQEIIDKHKLSGEGRWPNDRQLANSDDTYPKRDTEDKMSPALSKQEPLNQIFYGPPGTGKTYRTIEAAVKIAEPGAYNELKIKEKAGATPSQREELQKLYNQLLDAKRIQFVTFHQSYGYEEFVEGLSAKTEGDSLSYYEKDGVFKRICEDANKLNLNANSAINIDGDVWKISIGSTQANPAKTYCLDNNLAAIGWVDTGDLTSETPNEYFESLGSNSQNSLLYFSREMKPGDIVLCINSITSMEAIGVVTGDYYFKEEGIPSTDDYCHQRGVTWLAKGIDVDFKSLNGGKQFALSTCYHLSRLNVSEVIEHLRNHDVIVDKDAKPTEKNYVLIIDEINRGNISKIFGELITLIEPSKRMGRPEALEVVLPYSGDKFSVPNNLYIIGTMNTADRSLALMDTALRRRFDFVEMMPDYEVLKDDSGKPYSIETDKGNIELCTLLDKLNQRIAALYDREHMLGHAFFMPVVEAIESEGDEEALRRLKDCFQNKIIPLLAEYFFDDWQKIRLALADNQKQKAYQIIKAEPIKFSDLFGSAETDDFRGDEQVSYTLADADAEIWESPLTYLGMYKVISLPDAKTANESA